MREFQFVLESLSAECPMTRGHGSNLVGFGSLTTFGDKPAIDHSTLIGGFAETEVRGMRSNQGIVGAQPVLLERTPPKPSGVFGDAGSNRIELDVSIAPEKVQVVVDETGLESTLPKRPGSTHRKVEKPHVTTPYSLHQSANTSRFGGRCEKVDVIAHQDVCVHFAAEPISELKKIAQVFQIVDLEHKAWSSIDAALDDVLRNTG